MIREAWAERPLEEEYPFLVAEVMQIDVRGQGVVRSTRAMIVVGISEEGHREIPGFETHLRETKESWKELFEDLKTRRGLRRVELVTSDAHEGLEVALRSTFPGCIWQRCPAATRTKRSGSGGEGSGCQRIWKKVFLRQLPCWPYLRSTVGDSEPLTCSNGSSRKCVGVRR